MQIQKESILNLTFINEEIDVFISTVKKLKNIRETVGFGSSNLDSNEKELLDKITQSVSFLPD